MKDQKKDRKLPSKIIIKKKDNQITATTEGSLLARLNQLNYLLEKFRLKDYLTLLDNPARMFWQNLLYGIARGFGFGIGFSLLGAIGLYILDQLVGLNIPLIGDFIAKLMIYIESTKGIIPK